MQKAPQHTPTQIEALQRWWAATESEDGEPNAADQAVVDGLKATVEPYLLMHPDRED